MRAGSRLGFALLLASGCTSESRLWRISPWSSTASGDSERANLWPLAFVDRDRTAVLWPLMDFDKHGFAVRPLVSKDDSEWDVLYPLSHVDAERGEGWVLTGYSFRDNVGLFPLCNFGPSFNFVGPAFWLRDKGEVSDWGVFPIAYGDRASGDGYLLTAYSFGANKGVFPLCNFGPSLNFAGPAWWWREGEEVSSFGVFPLAGLGRFKYVGPAWWTPPDHEGPGAFGVFPLVWGDRGGDRLLVAPLYFHDLRSGHDLQPGHELRAALLPPTWWETKEDSKVHVVFPFYAHIADEKGELTAFAPFFARDTTPESEHWYTLLGNGWRTNGSSGLNVYPIFWSSRSPEATRQAFVPLYLYRERGPERLLITPLGGRGWDESGKTRFVNFLGPVYHHSTSADTETTSVLWPLFERERTAGTTTTRAFPLFSTTTSPSGTDAWMAAGLSRYVADRDSTSFRFWPLYGQSDAAEPPDPLFKWSLVSRQSHGEEWSHHFFPLYGASGNGKESSATALFGLAHVGTTELGRSWRFWPLASASNDEAADGWIDRATLFRHETRGDVTRDWLAPIYYGERRPGVTRDEALLSLARHVRTDEGSAWRLWPVFSYTDADELDDLIDAFTPIGIHPHSRKTHVHVGTSLIFALDFYGEEKRSWDVRTLTFFDLGHRERPAEAATTESVETEKPAVIERDHAGFLFDWFLVDHRVVATPDGGRHDESHYRLPLLHEYERSGDDSEWDLLCYAVHSKQTVDEGKFSVLGYGYRSERHGAETKRDIFPFITYDTAPDSTYFAFLWRLYHYERHGDRSGGHVLFIPWGDQE